MFWVFTKCPNGHCVELVRPTINNVGHRESTNQLFMRSHTFKFLDIVFKKKKKRNKIIRSFMFQVVNKSVPVWIYKMIKWRHWELKGVTNVWKPQSQNCSLDWTGLVTSTAGAQLDFKAHEEHYVNADDDNRIFALPLLFHLWTDAASFWLSRRGRCRRPDNYRVYSATCWGFMDITAKTNEK